MIEYLKNLVGIGEDGFSKKREYTCLTSEFERTVSTDFPSRKTADRTVETAKRIRNLLGNTELGLEREEKLKLLKMINRAKVRALLANEDYTFSLFSHLDSISADVATRV